MATSTRADNGAQTASSTRKALTIGAVAKILGREFDDISISKIRYLEDQKLLSPRRTPGGYRLYSQADVERLRSILQMQRDEFLPLRVIRQELASGGERADLRGGDRIAAPRGERRSRPRLADDDRRPGGPDGVSPEVIADLEQWRIVQPQKIEGQLMYSDTDREIAKACGELARFGSPGATCGSSARPLTARHSCWSR